MGRTNVGAGTARGGRAIEPSLARRSCLGGALAAAGCLAVGPGAAALAPVTGAAILTVKGTIGVANVDGEADFDRTAFDGLGRTQLVTWTPWTRGETTFEGVLATRLLDAVQASGTVASCHALNDYAVDIPLDDFRRYRTLLATHMNGTMLTPRDKGPIWVVFPWSDHPELDTRQARQRSIWQLVEMTIR